MTGPKVESRPIPASEISIEAPHSGFHEIGAPVDMDALRVGAQYERGSFDVAGLGGILDKAKKGKELFDAGSDAVDTYEKAREVYGKLRKETSEAAELKEKTIQGVVAECDSRLKLLSAAGETPEIASDQKLLRRINSDLSDNKQLEAGNEKALVALVEKLRDATRDMEGQPAEVDLLERGQQKNLCKKLRALTNQLGSDGKLSEDGVDRAITVLDEADNVLNAKRREGEKEDPKLEPARQIELLKLHYELDAAAKAAAETPKTSPADSSKVEVG